MKKDDFDKYLQKQLKNSNFRKEWEKSEAGYQITRELIKVRIAGKISQRELAKRANTTQAVISRIENMTVNPSIELLHRIASSLGKNLEIKLT